MIRTALFAAAIASPSLAGETCDEWLYLIDRLGCADCANTAPLVAILEGAWTFAAANRCTLAEPVTYAALLDAATFPALRLPETMLMCDGWTGDTSPIFAAPQTTATTLAQLTNGDDLTIDHDWIGAGASWDYVTIRRDGARVAMGWTQAEIVQESCGAYSDLYVENGEAGD